MKRPDLLAAVIGHPVAHSLSPVIFDFLSENVSKSRDPRLLYFKQDIHPADLAAWLTVLRSGKPGSKLPFIGLNVTLPHKQSIIPHLDRLSREADETGAVNVVEVLPSRQGPTRLKGHNTDVFGLTRTFEEHEIPLRGQSVVVLGAGGAANAVISALAKSRVKDVWVWTRRERQARGLCSSANRRFKRTRFHSLSTLKRAPESVLYVNTTPLGMLGFPDNNLLDEIVLPRCSRPAWAFDLVYRPEQTTFLRRARQKGLQTVGGLDMLIWQALATWEIWFGPLANPQTLKRGLEKHLRKLRSRK